MVFGVGIISWLILDSVVLHQLATGGLDAKMRNFMGIYTAPGAIVLVAYQVLSGHSSDLVTYALAGYTLFLVFSLTLSYSIHCCHSVRCPWSCLFADREEILPSGCGQQDLIKLCFSPLLDGSEHP